MEMELLMTPSGVTFLPCQLARRALGRTWVTLLECNNCLRLLVLFRHTFQGMPHLLDFSEFGKAENCLEKSEIKRLTGKN